MLRQIIARLKRQPQLSRCPAYAALNRQIADAKAKHAPVSHLYAAKRALVHEALSKAVR